MRSMNYNQARAKYWKKKIEDPLPPLPEDERIYLNVPYMARDFARYSHCGFDPDRKLWFTGCMNANLYFLVDLYGVVVKEKFEGRCSYGSSINATR